LEIEESKIMKMTQISASIQNSIFVVSGQLLAEIIKRIGGKCWKCRKKRQKSNCFQLWKPLPSIEGSKESLNAGNFFFGMVSVVLQERIKKRITEQHENRKKRKIEKEQK
jgi:hypothetical protein